MAKWLAMLLAKGDYEIFGDGLAPLLRPEGPLVGQPPLRLPGCYSQCSRARDSRV